MSSNSTTYGTAQTDKSSKGDNLKQSDHTGQDKEGPVCMCVCMRVFVCARLTCLLGSANETLCERYDQCTPWLEQTLAMNINFAFIASCSPWHLTWHKRESAFCLCQRLSWSAARLLHPASLPQGHRHTWCGRCPRQQKRFFTCRYHSSCERQPQQTHVSCSRNWHGKELSAVIYL